MYKVVQIKYTCMTITINGLDAGIVANLDFGGTMFNLSLIAMSLYSQEDKGTSL